jgi:uncharacterized protein YeaO (DUF488 family)
MSVKLKRIFDPPDASDGVRVLVDRLWPRGVTKQRAQVDEWMKDLAPSAELRGWFGHRADRWPLFCDRYRNELAAPALQPAILHLRTLARRRTVTLLFAAKDVERNNALVLASVIKTI